MRDTRCLMNLQLPASEKVLDIRGMVAKQTRWMLWCRYELFDGYASLRHPPGYPWTVPIFIFERSHSNNGPVDLALRFFYSV